MLSLPNYIRLNYFKLKELPDSDGPLSKSVAWSQLIAWLIHAINSANIENGVGGNEEDEKCVLYHQVSISAIAIRKSSQTLMCWVSLLAV